MGDLVAFVNARLDEDETTARAAGSRPSREASGWQRLPAKDTDMNAAAAAHIARHDPARALREVAASRAIVEFYLEPPNGFRPGIAQATGGAAGRPGQARVLTVIEAIMLDIAAIWSDHPDYHPAWRP